MNRLHLVHINLTISLIISLIILAVLLSTHASTVDSNYKQFIIKRFARSPRNVPGYFRQSQTQYNPHRLCIRMRHASYHQKLQCKKQKFPECVKHKNQVKKVKDNLRETLRTSVNAISYHSIIDRESERMLTLAKLFHGFDTNNDGSISTKELENYLVLYNLIPPSFMPAAQDSGFVVTGTSQSKNS